MYPPPRCDHPNYGPCLPPRCDHPNYGPCSPPRCAHPNYGPCPPPRCDHPNYGPCPPPRCDHPNYGPCPPPRCAHPNCGPCTLYLAVLTLTMVRVRRAGDWDGASRPTRSCRALESATPCRIRARASATPCRIRAQASAGASMPRRSWAPSVASAIASANRHTTAADRRPLAMRATAL
eukprot:2687132-Prymnesium_polylepis.2